MNVIAIKESKKIVKGVKYEIEFLRNSIRSTTRNNGKIVKGIVRIKGIGDYVVTNFTDLNGNPLPKEDWKSSVESEKRLEFGDLKINDILICRRDDYATLVKDSMYRIVDIRERKIKFEGCSRYFKFSSWRFSRVPLGQVRSLQLSSVLDGVDQSYSVDIDSRKIDIISDKNPVLIKALAKSILDEYRHELDIIDWTCRRGSKLKINRDDYKKLLKMSLSEILKMVETK